LIWNWYHLFTDWTCNKRLDFYFVSGISEKVKIRISLISHRAYKRLNDVFVNHNKALILCRYQNVSFWHIKYLNNIPMNFFLFFIRKIWILGPISNLLPIFHISYGPYQSSEWKLIFHQLINFYSDPLTYIKIKIRRIETMMMN